MFNFFLNSYRKGILTFSGTTVDVEFKLNSEDGRMTFRKYDNGYFKNKVIKTRHPNIVYSVIKGKKSWGLWVQQWSDGIVENSFTKEEILKQFDGIKIPKPLLNDFDNIIEKKKIIKYQKYYNELFKN